MERVFAGPLAAYAPVEIRLVGNSSEEPLWDELVRRHHYLGYRRLLGHRLKYLAFIREQPVAALSFSGAALMVRARDRFIGWNPEQRRAHLKSIANNSRFLILPSVQIPHLASHVLGRCVRRARHDWPQRSGHPLWIVETFVDPERYRGTSYRAANWQYLGESKGYGKEGISYRHHGERKEIYLQVLEPRFRRLIGCAPLPPCRPSRMTTVEERAMITRHVNWDPRLVPAMDLEPSDLRAVSEELRTFHKQFHPSYGRTEHQRLGLAYLGGLVSASAVKSVEPIAMEMIGEQSVSSLQKFMKYYRWDHERMAAQHRRLLAPLIGEPEGMICLDSSEFAKKGQESVGVARQYCGELGKLENCQSGVFVGYCGCKGYGLLAGRLYMPESWFGEDQRQRREDNLVPEDLVFATKPQLARALIDQVIAEGHFPARWVGCDATFGADPAFLSGLPAGLYYLAQTRANTQVFRRRPRVGIPPYQGRGAQPTKERVLSPRMRAIEVSRIGKDRRTRWQRVVLAEGAKGPIIAEVARLRVTRALEGLPHGEELWLVLRRHEDGQIRYAFSNAPADMPFAQMCDAIGMRWAIEQCFQEGKSHLGMGSYEHRSWPAWHRHMIYVFLAQHLVLRLRLRWKKNSGAHPAAGTQDRGDHLAPQVMESKQGAPGHPLPHPPQSSGLPGSPEKTSRCDVGSYDVTGDHAL
jgi:SRSO17 transposase